MSKPQKIVVAGAGPAGLFFLKGLRAELAKATAPNVTVTIINPNSHFIHYPATVRMVVTAEGSLEDQIIVPYPPSFNEGIYKFIVGKVSSVHDDDATGQRYVELQDGERVEYDVLVLATGSYWESSNPIAFPVGQGKEGVVKYVNGWRSKLEKAKDVVLVGAGAIGLEISGEIRDFWPNANVTIIHGQRLPLNDAYPDKWRKDLLKRFSKRGVHFELDEIVDDVEIHDGHISTRKGKAIKADLVISTRGARPNTKFIESLGPDALASSGYVRVKSTLQLAKHSRIFAIGDIIEWNEQKQSAKAMNHGPLVAKNVLALLSNNANAKLVSYKGSKEMIALTNGQNGGSIFLGVWWGIILGDWFTKMLKSKKLFADSFKGLVGL